MISLHRTWTRFWFAPAALGDLALCRILWAGAQLAHLLLGDTAQRIAGGLRPFEPSGDRPLILHLLSLPLGGSGALDREKLEIVFVVTTIAGVLSLAGVRTRWSLFAFAWGSLLLQAWATSTVRLSHHVGLLQWSLVLLSFSPCGEVLSVDALLARRSARGSAGLDRPRPRDLRAGAAWPLRLVHALLALAYLSAATSKVLRGLEEWVGGWTLQYYASFQALHTGSAPGRWLAERHAWVVAMAWVVIVFEGSFWVSIFLRRWAWVYAVACVLLHAGSIVFLDVYFPSFPVLCAAMVPWHRTRNPISVPVRE